MGFNTKSFDWGSPFTQAIDNTGGPDGKSQLYIGLADPGTAKSSARWKIQKLIYDASTGAVSDIQWANGTIDFDKVWNNRAVYTYS